MDSPDEHLGAVVRRERERRLLRLRDVASPAGVTTSALSRYERGLSPLAWSRFVELLTTMGLQPRVRVEPQFADLDGAIERLAAMAPDQRIGGLCVDLSQVTAALRKEGVRFAVSGASAALLYGVPVPVRALEVTLARDAVDVDDPELPDAEYFAANVVRFIRSMRSVHARIATSLTDPAPARPPIDRLRTDAVTRYRLPCCALDVRMADADIVLGAVCVRVGEVDVPVVPFDRLTLDDPALRRALARVRERADAESG